MQGDPMAAGGMRGRHACGALADLPPVGNCLTTIRWLDRLKGDPIWPRTMRPMSRGSSMRNAFRRCNGWCSCCVFS
ncbi:protein of unknown function [Cupriavidus taiwanensis]|uniref:Uncharacterized protein n=1 Tax=Cupriavidus taiwanensis TaxID=164546 RepID=A0A375IE73_9BURK|nr:hypothetical protein CBM2617_A190102 [Cupriavidus taiwanensis]SOZ78619.1 hypothetical protein CBM2618_A170217 [Cupriavidus taiwanensis]SOZ78783.1 hypothetical protein CBM2622_A160218 [Cupriavidus taiwanensis]SOZ85682.1 hypothetical protein CBM2621_A160220 [Cupriavidus taiwanensis]SPA44952.1 hypothetical protein CBM2629_A170179 [Cupriavidus taiwanensis]